MITVIEQRPPTLPLATACEALSLNRSTVYSWRSGANKRPDPSARCRKHAPQPKALSPAEHQTMLDTAFSERYRDQPVYEIYHDLLDNGQCLASLSTWHRVLRKHNVSGERRPQRAPQRHAIPRLTASEPNQVWSWDITKLPTRRRAEYLNLYVVLDLFSRFIVAWMISRKENAALAQQLMSEAAQRYDIRSGSLTLHQDRGSPMIAHSYLDLMAELGVTCSHSRPRVSNDNAFSESQFKTSKYQPDYPGRFDSVAHAQQWVKDYVQWYNHEHHHSGLAGFTPEQVFTGRHQAIAQQKQQALDARFAEHPERFVKGRPTVALPPTTVSINPVQPDEDTGAVSTAVNFPTLLSAKHTARESTLTD